MVCFFYIVQCAYVSILQYTYLEEAAAQTEGSELLSLLGSQLSHKQSSCLQVQVH